MTTMDHAAAHERIEDLVLEPTRLAALARSTAPADVALREHVAACAACRADLEGSERLQRHLADALPRSSLEARAAVEPAELPPSLRARVVSAARVDSASGVAGVAGTTSASQPHGPISIARSRSGRAIATWVGLAASLIVLAGAAGIIVDQVSRRSAAEADAQELFSALAAVERVLADPEHRVVELRSPGGTPAGSISWSRHDLVVLTTALPPPAEGDRYRCWLEEDGASVLVGSMYFIDRTAYWIGSLDEWATFQIGPATRFVVTLEDAGSQVRAGPTVLSADLGSS